MTLKSLFKRFLNSQNPKSASHSLFSLLRYTFNADTRGTSLGDVTQCTRVSFSIGRHLNKIYDKTRLQQQSSNKNQSFQNRNTTKHEYLFGVGPCHLALKSGRRRINKIFIRDDAVNTSRLVMTIVCFSIVNVWNLFLCHMHSRVEFTDIWKMAEDRGLQVLPVTRKKLMGFSQGRPAQNIVMEVSPLKFSTFEYGENKSILQISNDHPKLWLALDEVQDPMNFGAILRTCCLLGLSGVVVPQQNSAPLSPVVSKASAGAMEVMNIFQVANLVSFLQERSEAGWDVLGAVQPNPREIDEKLISCTDYKLIKPTVLVLGNEGIGLQTKIKQQCTRFVSIFPPSSRSIFTKGKFGPHLSPDSLNVSVATGILVFSILNNKPLQETN